MSTTSGEQPGGHVVARFSSRLHEVLNGLLEAPVWSMTVNEQRTVLVELDRAEARLAELRLRVLAAADRADVAADSGASSTAAWWAHAARRVGSVARAEVRLATALDGPCAKTRDALARGTVDVGQARVIVTAVAALPEQVDQRVRQLAEEHLITLAGVHDEKALRVLGRRVLDVIDPEGADLEDGRRLTAEETAAARATYLHLFDNGDGTHTGRFKIASLHAAMLRKMLEALIGARRPPDTGTGTGTGTGTEAGTEGGGEAGAEARAERAEAQADTGTDADADAGAGGGAGQADQADQASRLQQPTHPEEPEEHSQPRNANAEPDPVPEPAPEPAPEVERVAVRASRPELLGEAFGELLERVPADRLPTSGGVSATVVVLLDYDKLLTGIGTATLNTGEQVSAATARRLACEAGVIPVVYQRLLGGRSVVLDMGRTTRFHTLHQRIALDVEQGGCSAVGCDRPSGWCHAHHKIAWAAGGSTSVTNGRLLCPFHHHRAHDHRYDVRDLPDGKLELHRRT